MAPQKGDKQSNTTGENRRCGGEIANFIRKFLRQELFNGKNRRRAVTRIQNAQIYDQEEGNPKREPRQPSNEEAQWNSNRWSERKREIKMATKWMGRVRWGQTNGMPRQSWAQFQVQPASYYSHRKPPRSKEGIGPNGPRMGGVQAIDVRICVGGSHGVSRPAKSLPTHRHTPARRMRDRRSIFKTPGRRAFRLRIYSLDSVRRIRAYALTGTGIDF